jgi:hypothetical protein
MKKEQKLYRVNLKGMKYSGAGGGPTYGVSYVVAQNPTEAYEKVKKFVDDEDLGFSKNREMESIELIASDYQYNNTGHILFL